MVLKDECIHLYNSLNKCDWIEEYLKQLDSHDYDLEWALRDRLAELYPKSANETDVAQELTPEAKCEA
jgi:hypothetical protein